MSARAVTPTPAAFFDLDKTLVPGSSLFLLARGFHQRGFLRSRDIASFALRQLRFRLLGSERRADIGAARNAALTFVEGRSQDELVSLSEEIAHEQILPQVYPEMTEEIEQHRSAGEPTFVVTAAPVELAELVADGLGMHGALGTVAEVNRSNRYTGALDGPVLHSDAKAAAVDSFASARGIDLAASAAYADSINDLPLLELVGHPRAVNPDRRLRRVARGRRWPVIELRRGRRGGRKTTTL